MPKGKPHAPEFKAKVVIVNRPAFTGGSKFEKMEPPVQITRVR